MCKYISSVQVTLSTLPPSLRSTEYGVQGINLCMLCELCNPSGAIEALKLRCIKMTARQTLIVGGLPNNNRAEGFLRMEDRVRVLCTYSVTTGVNIGGSAVPLCLAHVHCMFLFL